MKILKLLIVLLLLSIVSAYPQSFEWGGQLGGIKRDGVNAITTDADGNSYITGHFLGTADFDPGPGVVNLTSVQLTDMFILKLDASGNFLWVKHIGGPGSGRGTAITLDASGNIYTTGFFAQTTDFNPGPGVANLITNYNSDVFILKLDNDGNYVWAKNVGSYLSDEGVSIKLDAAGNIHVAGIFYDVGDFDPGPGTANLTSPGGRSVFIMKLNNQGGFLWAKAIAGEKQQVPQSMALDPNGNVYVTGEFNGSTDFDPGPDSVNVSSKHITTSDIFVLKLDSNGNYVWSKQFGTELTDKGTSLQVDAIGNTYTIGYFNGTIDFNPDNDEGVLVSKSTPDIFVLKMDKNGNYIWVKHFAGFGTNEGAAIALDAIGNIYTLSNFKNTVDFDPGEGIANFTSLGQFDVAMVKLDNDGNYKWAKSWGSNLSVNGIDIQADAMGNIYTAGIFSNTIDLNPGLDTLSFISKGDRDIFIVKLASCSVTEAIISLTSCDSIVSPSGRYTWKSSGTYRDVVLNTAGCDSLITVNLTIGKSVETELSDTFCEGEIYVFGTQNLTTAGEYTELFQSSTGCDSMVVLNLTMNPVYNEVAKVVICEDEPYIFGTQKLSSSGVYTETFQSQLGCDSTVVLTLTAHPVYKDTITATICEGETYVFESQSLTVAGEYTKVFQAMEGCDSTIMLVLNVVPSTNIASVTICRGDTYVFGTQNLTTAGEYTELFQSSTGCDSTVVLTLSTTEAYNETASITICEGETYVFGTQTLSTSGEYTELFMASGGCDSTVVLTLTVKPFDNTIVMDGKTLRANQSNASYQWVNCSQNNEQIDGANNQSFAPTENGSYAVILSKDGCSVMSDCFELITTGIINNTFGSELKVYPNPTPGLISIDLGGYQDQVRLTITNILGKVVSKYDFTNRREVSFNLTGEAGLYLIHILDRDGRTAIIRVLKQ